VFKGKEMTAYVGWLKEARGGWVAVAEGDSIAACHKALISTIHKRALVPAASAVLPAGQDPEQRLVARPGNGQDDAGGHGEG
jgi:hypothetical protein